MGASGSLPDAPRYRDPGVCVTPGRVDLLWMYVIFGLLAPFLRAGCPSCAQPAPDVMGCRSTRQFTCHTQDTINKNKQSLLRKTRRTLAQLRTNKSPFLKSYLHKIDPQNHPSPLCPICNTQNSFM